MTGFNSFRSDTSGLSYILVLKNCKKEKNKNRRGCKRNLTQFFVEEDKDFWEDR